MAKCAKFDPVVEALAADIAGAKDLLTELHDRLYSEPNPGPHAIARTLVEVGEVKTRLAGLLALVGGASDAVPEGPHCE
ncbi:MAG TPA: hypothetical protein VM597_11355 [Gemmataceae bacterium]|jgi:hypothetical protein|nr:hypothetical protein [Gemmataceae bacterium]